MMRCALLTGWEVCSTVSTYFKTHFIIKLCRMKSTKMVNSWEISIFRVNWGHSKASQHFLKNYNLEQKLYKLQPLVIGTFTSPEFHIVQLMSSFKRLLFCVRLCTCSLNFSSFSNCSLWFFSSCSISFWCFMASYRYSRDRNVTVQWLYCIKLRAWT